MSKPVAARKPKRLHRGDTMSVETRSAVMSRIRGSGTKPERMVHEILLSLNLAPELQVRELPGRPDFLIRPHGIAVFVDGDFWHGWRFPAWRLKLSEQWEEKIDANRRRDRRNHARLRRSGWVVIRVWEHQLVRNPDRVRERIRAALR